MSPPAFLAETVDAVRRRRPPATVAEFTAGDGLLLVRLDDGDSAGAAHRPPGPVPDPSGLDAGEVAAWATDPSLAPVEGSDGRRGARAVGLAALNALSAPLTDWREGDPLATLPREADVIATVGLFRPAFRRFEDVTVRVIERVDRAPPETPPGVAVEWHDPGEHRAALADAEVAFVTGSSLVYGGTDRYLAATPASTPVVLIGATASFYPPPAFEAGVSVLAGAAVEAYDRLRPAVADGACGTDAHDAGLRKVFVADG